MWIDEFTVNHPSEHHWRELEIRWYCPDKRPRCYEVGNVVAVNGHYYMCVEISEDTIRPLRIDKFVLYRPYIATDLDKRMTSGRFYINSKKNAYHEDLEEAKDNPFRPTAKDLINEMYYVGGYQKKLKNPDSTTDALARYFEKPEKPIYRPWFMIPAEHNEISKVIFSGPATVVLWKDGSKTIVKKDDDTHDDPEKALLYSYLKHILPKKEYHRVLEEIDSKKNWSFR